MSIEATLTALLNPICGNRVYWDTLDEGYVIAAPVLICQQVGGEAFWYVDDTMPSHKNARIQITVWGQRRKEVNTLARLVEKTICEAHLTAKPVGAFVSDYEEPLKLFGTRQQFDIWYLDP